MTTLDEILELYPDLGILGRGNPEGRERLRARAAEVECVRQWFVKKRRRGTPAQLQADAKFDLWTTVTRGEVVAAVLLAGREVDEKGRLVE